MQMMGLASVMQALIGMRSHVNDEVFHSLRWILGFKLLFLARDSKE
jgi:hypothetical protein